MSKRKENGVTMHYAGVQVDMCQDFAIDENWDDDTTYRFLQQIAMYADGASEQYKPEWAKR